MENNEVAQAAAEQQIENKKLSTLEGGVVSLETLTDQFNFAKLLMRQGLISETFKTPQQVVVGLQYCKELNLQPIAGLKMMYVVNGKPSLYSEGPLSLVQRSPMFGKIREWFVNPEGEEICPQNKNLRGAVYFGAVTEVWRYGDSSPQVDFFTLEDMERAGLDKNKYGKKETWLRWERIMLRYKARTLALRSKFADLIAGIPIAEYDSHFSPEVPEVVHADPSSERAVEVERAYHEPQVN